MTIIGGGGGFRLNYFANLFKISFLKVYITLII